MELWFDRISPADKKRKMARRAMRNDAKLLEKGKK
jgi:hypothetical protein